jgi:hypothetical protein
MHDVAVDFAKHGTNVDKRKLDMIEVNEYPDYMQSKGKKSYESDSVLGKIYRSIDLEKEFEEFRDNEWKFTIDLDYKMNDRFLTAPSEFLPYLDEVYNDIVYPFTREIRESIINKFYLSEES